MGKIYYKYRDFKSLDRIEAILKDNEIYAAIYKHLNDPMEGLYRLNNKEDRSNIIEQIYTEKNILKICSFSAKNYDKLMWSHYSDSCKGIVIGVKLKFSPTKIIYDGRNNFTSTNDAREDAKKILSHKNDVWCYEDEYRLFTRDQKVQVEIVEIFLGMNISEKNEKSVISICEKIKTIKVYKQQNDYSFIPEYEY